MGILSQAVLVAYQKPEDDGYHRGQLTITGVSPCAYATFLNYHKVDKRENRPEDILRMKNGHWQEEEAIYDLTKAGFKLQYTGRNQLKVHVGRAKVGGRPDGLIDVGMKTHLLEVKAMDTMRSNLFKNSGLDTFPNYKCQIQLYMASDELKGIVNSCQFYVKHKDSCHPYDAYFEAEPNYIKPIIEAVDAIILDGEEVRKPTEPTSLCRGCRHANFCWKSEIIDTSKVSYKELDAVAQMWRDGKAYKAYGEELISVARNTLEAELGDSNLLVASDLKVQRIESNRSSISIPKFVEVYGADSLSKVLSVTKVSQLRITDLL